MHEKELRLALVCYGGVSLAVYMSGVTKEVLKVVRASKTYHSIVDPEARRDTSYDEVAGDVPYESDTERLYFELFQAFAPELELRVVVDIVSGASAGGINAIFLARALAHDLSLDNHRLMWLQQADVTELMEPDTIADRWSKFYLYPIFWMMNWNRLKKMVPNDETRRKLSIFMRSRWFKPPFSGRHMLNWMIEACVAMGTTHSEEQQKNKTLMPPGLRLDLFVSLTNFYGRHQEISLHDPALITEREHRKTLTFSYLRRETEQGAGDFDDTNIAGLAFAARSTSSFPGAFPPAQLRDLDRSLRETHTTWPARDRFFRRNFPQRNANDPSPQEASFIDGSVVNNKPFAAAIEALEDRPAHREVDRRIVYIDPVPEDLTTEDKNTPPGFFRSILASLSEIPRNEPITDELQWINTHNRQSRRLRSIIASVKTEVNETIDRLTMEDYGESPSVALVSSWRDQVNALAKEHAGYTYAGYSHTKIFGLFERMAELLCSLCEAGGAAPTREDVLALVHKWAHSKGLLSESMEDDALTPSEAEQVDEQALIGFLRDFDVDFRVRRLRFVISSLNEIYQSPAARQSQRFDPLQLNDMKREIYIYIDQLKDRWRALSYVENARGEVAGLTSAMEDGDGEAQVLALSTLLSRLADLMELQDRDFRLDTTISTQIAEIRDLHVRQELFRAYIGFPFFDVLTLPLLQTNDVSALEPIRVDRISPEDCNAIRSGGASAILKGIGFARFAAFFSRADRENDYLWGRLNSAERLVDFIVSAGETAQGECALSSDFDLPAFKKRLFLSIVEAERPHLQVNESLLDDLHQEITGTS
jgi:patatin-related protein